MICDGAFFIIFSQNLLGHTSEFDPEPMYRYKYPSDFIHPLGRAMYWDLMNMVRARPYFRQFKAAQFTKHDYAF